MTPFEPYDPNSLPPEDNDNGVPIDADNADDSVDVPEMQSFEDDYTGEAVVSEEQVAAINDVSGGSEYGYTPYVPPLSYNDEVPDYSSAAGQDFESLSVAQMLGLFRRAPMQTWRAFVAVAKTPAPREGAVRSDAAQFYPRPYPGAVYPPGVSLPYYGSPEYGAQPVVAADELPADTEQEKALPKWLEALQLILRVAALGIALWGSSILAGTPNAFRTETGQLDTGAPYLIGSFLIWLVSELIGSDIGEWWRRFTSSQPRTSESLQSVNEYPARASAWSGIHPVRVLFAIMGLLLSLLAWRYTLGNNFTTEGFWAWVGSIALWVAAVAPAHWRPDVMWRKRPTVNLLSLRQHLPTIVALLAIMAFGAFFRLSNLEQVPPEMTSDHVEKLLDSQRVLDGTHQVFFPNNGGREPAQMYFMALLSQVPGLGMNFTTLKLLTVIEGLLTLPALWWMGREIIGRKERRLGNIVGLLLAALVAASYWHTVLSRLALRIVLTPLVVSLLLIYLSRAMRYNRRADFIKAGLVIGFGLYTYQAARILPVVVVIGIALAFLVKARKDRPRTDYLTNFAVLVLVALVVFVPLFAFSIQSPNDFWRRTSGRLLGDDIITLTDTDGNITERNATVEERIQAFNTNMPVLLSNIRSALLMWNWKGDVAWINGAPNYPTMDVLAGSLLILGAAAWLARMIRRRDVVDWLLPVAIFVLLLPSAFSIAYPIENPSATRTSGTLPEVYLLAALPLALMLRSLIRLMPRYVGPLIAVIIAGYCVVTSYVANAAVYFNPYVTAYLDSALPYSEAGRVLREFNESVGSDGNGFMIGYAYWWDHRAVGLDAGLVDWPNGIISTADIPSILAATSVDVTRYRFDPTKDMMFFYAAEDADTQLRLQAYFPTGFWQEYISYQPEDHYKIFRVPPLGIEGFNQWLIDNGIEPPLPALPPE
ncbi:MAG: hypothetical protein H7175_25215 [Burkholderiales bacterium]|nr:hypothetical protein [Anaerolineae bacterium]